MNRMTIRLSNLTTEQLTKWLEIIQQYPDNVTHWDAKKQPKPILREARSWDGLVMVEPEDDEEVEAEDYEEPVIEDQDVVVRITDPDERSQPTVSGLEELFEDTSGWSELFEDKVVYPNVEDTSSTQPNDPSM